MDALVLNANEARLNLTINGENGDFPDAIPFDASDSEIKSWAAEAVRNGGVPGIAANSTADFTDFVVERYNATSDVPVNRVLLRPKVPFGC